jgi:type I restriction enzyme S subunit
MSYKRLGDYIEPCNKKNKGDTIKILQGISNRKYFQKAKTNTIGVDLSKYRIVRTGQFAFNRATTRNGDRISIALRFKEDCIVSPSYRIFKSKDENILNSEYLMMWFKRPEFDRYARFRSHGSAHEFFDYDEMCEVKLPIPSIEKQQQIVAEYNTVTNRINLNNQLNQKLEATAQALYKHWFVDFEFPNEEGKPYKSSGGEMVYNEELDKDIPVGWSKGKLSDFSKIKGGKRMPAGTSLIKDKTKHTYIKVADLGKSKYVHYNKKFEFVPTNVAPKISRYITHQNDVIISIVGTIGVVKILGASLNGANLTENCMKITELNKFSPSYLYHYLVSKEGREEIQIRNVGAVQAKLPMYNIESFPIIIPQGNVMEKFDEIINDLDKKINNLVSQSQTLQELQSLLLAKMTKVEIEKETMKKKKLCI